MRMAAGLRPVNAIRIEQPGWKKVNEWGDTPLAVSDMKCKNHGDN